MSEVMALPDQFKEKLARTLEEEESDLFVLTMHYRNNGDLNFFNQRDQKRIKSILDTLIHDTERHATVLKMMIYSGEK